MIDYVTGDIFESKQQCLVNPVNCVGVMGGGLALDFRRRFPAMYETYKEVCKNGELAPGKLVFYAEKHAPNRPICLFPTKNHWRELSTLDLIERGLQAFIRYAPDMKIDSVAFPKLGCGLGGLNWEYQVKPLFERYMEPTVFNIQVYL